MFAEIVFEPHRKETSMKTKSNLTKEYILIYRNEIWYA